MSNSDQASKGVRKGSAPNFAPPVQEGETFTFEDENGDKIQMEFLGLIVDGDTRFAYFFPVTQNTPAKSSGEVVVTEVTELDEDGQPSGFELVTDNHIADEAYEMFKKATKDIYRFE